MAAPLGSTLAAVLDGYATEKAAHTSPAHSALPTFIRDDLAQAVSAVVQSAGWPHRVKGSAGVGVWAETPWVAAFDEDITTSAQRGFYVVYLFRPDGAAVYLTLDQGTTEVQNDFGRNYLTVLRQRADEAARLLAADGALDSSHKLGPVDLAAAGGLSRGYEAGAIAHVPYMRGDLPGSEAALRRDLERMLVVYRRLVDLRLDLGLIATEEDAPEGVETGKYRWHRSRERNRKLAEQIKKARGYNCEVCGVNFRRRYPSVGRDYIEAHHLTPISALAGRPTNVGVDDFVVVCSNCHRMLHTANPPIAPKALRSALGPLI